VRTQSAERRSGDAEAKRLLHELQTHQIELETQNEKLRRTQSELEASRARYFDLYELAPVGFLVVSQQGLIVESNITAARLLGAARNDLTGKPLVHFIFRDDQDVFYLHHKQLFEKGAPQECELRLLNNRRRPQLFDEIRWFRHESA